MSLKLKNIILCFLLCLFGIGFVVYLCFIPCKLLVVGLPDPFYLDQKITHNDFQVYYESLFGIKLESKDYYYMQDDSNLSVIAKGFYKEIALHGLEPDSYDISYDTKVYVGQMIDGNKLHVKASYADGTVREITDVMTPLMAVPMADHCTIQLACNAGQMDWETDVVKPVSVKASYSVDAQLGDLFDRSNVIVTLSYPDDTEINITDFDLPALPSYLTGKISTEITTPYGNTTLKIRPQNMQRLKASYNGKVYVGDTLKLSDFSFTMKTKNGETKEIKDFTFDDPGPLKTDTNVVLHSNYGDGTVKVHPIRVKSCKGETQGELIEGKMPEFKHVTLYYEDGKKLEVPADQVEFTNLTDGSNAGLSTVYFIYNGVYYWFELSAIPTEIVNLRKTDVDLSGQATKYTLTDAQVDAIAIVCQRLAGDDLEAIAAEASLLANRYELYGGGSDTDGSYLVKYMLESGYWGIDVADYIANGTAIDKSAFIVEDVLENGYRSLPLYIDERAGESDIVGKNSTEFEPDQTEIHKSDGNVFRFYSFPSDGLRFAYGYTDNAYQKVKGSVPAEPNPKSAVRDLEDDDEDDGIIIE